MRWRPVVRRLCVGKQITADSGTLRLISDFENSSCYQNPISAPGEAGKLAACHFYGCWRTCVSQLRDVLQSKPEFGDGLLYRRITDLITGCLTVKDAKVNFDSQLEKLEEAIPAADDFDMYGVYPAIDACVALE